MTSYLLILSLVGIAVQILGYFTNQNLEKILNVIYVIFVMIWLVQMNVKWNKKEAVHSYQWNTEEFQRNESVQERYRGFFAISQISQKIKKKNNFKTQTRKILLEIPFILLGIGIIICCFVVFITFTNQVLDLSKDLSYSYGVLNHDQSIIFWKAVIGVINGVAIFIFEVIYEWLSRKVIYLENHKYKITETQSYVILNFIF